MTTQQVLEAITSEPDAVQQLVLLSRYYGSDPSFVIAGGGNTSLKDEDVLFVKASGTSLGAISAEGFSQLHRAPLDDLLASEPDPDPNIREEIFKNRIMAARLHPERGQRPSVECVIHHLLPSRFVLHTHSTVVNTVTCCQSGREIAMDIFGDDILWVEYVTPGFLLAKEIKRLHDEWCARHGKPFVPAVLMANHGLIVCGDTPDEILRNTNMVVEKIAAYATAKPDGEEPFGAMRTLDANSASRLMRIAAPALRGLLADGAEHLKVVTLDDSEPARAIACGENGKGFVDGGPLTPDQIVYAGSWPLWVSLDPHQTEEEIISALRKAHADFVEKRGTSPKVVIVRGLGVFSAGDTLAGALTVADVYRDAILVMRGAAALGQVSYLTDEQRTFIEEWEVEAYRKKVSVAANAGLRASGKVALVTGAAQGFGLEIAQHLAGEGAHVILADLNREGVESAARQIESQKGQHLAFPVEMNVTCAKSLKAAMEQTIRRFGGLDLLVANAGVVRAGSVKDMEARDFEFVTDVNYKGYFLCAQAAATVMAIQHQAAPQSWADIIQINSKSGLAGSNRNGAYAGSKFGGIGLTQSFALELVEDGIKVNSICPGNFFDGPLWSDPQDGLFVQYLESGKVPGARTIEDVKRAYESKVPMGRGCRTIDVMRAIYYILEQKYETGQAIPVTGGQVMLS